MNSYLIIGGGISGLYTAYQLNKRYPDKRIVLYEKNDYYGGRIKGFKYRNLSWEEGAARFNSNHKLLIRLIGELGLKDKIIKINAETNFAPIDRSKYSEKILKNSAYYYINKIINRVKQDKEYNLTFEEYSRMSLGDEITNYVIDSYGYNVELTVMNLVDAVRMFQIDMNPHIQFYSLKGGLHILIDKLVKHLNEIANIKLHKSSELLDLEYKNSKFLAKIHLNGKGIKVVESDNCILAIPRYGLEKIDLLTSRYKIDRQIRSVICKPLCRIYSIFRESWFSDIIKTTTDSKIRYVIPIDSEKGLIMSSYTDGKYANRINSYYLKYKYDKLNSMLVKELRRVFKDKDKDIKTPLFTNVSYWECGAGYWRKGVNSKVISENMLHPIDNMNLFIVGENYSTSQAWIEGGLQTVDNLFHRGWLR